MWGLPLARLLLELAPWHVLIDKLPLGLLPLWILPLWAPGSGTDFATATEAARDDRQGAVFETRSPL